MCATPLRNDRKSGIARPCAAGAHLVRHSLATQLVAQRRPINEIADLLGHRSIDTTAIYVKVAVRQLADRVDGYVTLHRSLGYSFRKQAATLRALARFVEAKRLDGP